jgi:peptide/nickel transport system ATP-binding protein
VSANDASAVLDVRNLTVAYSRAGKRTYAVRDVSLSIRRGEAYGLVGESGCGKSTLAFAVMRHLPAGGSVVSGSVLFESQDMLSLSPRALQELRGNKIAMVYQDPGTALNPVMRAGAQIAEVYRAHAGLSRSEAQAAALAMLGRVRLPGEAVADRYPHQLSGGMQQRVVIAMALATNPALLVLDEPTTGLDATVEAGILDLIADLRRQYGTTILLISHNLAVLAQVCDRVGVLYAGDLVEEGSVAEVFAAPRHPYTSALLACLPGPTSHKVSSPVRPIPGAMPHISGAAASCAFAPRCPLVQTACTQRHPPLGDTDHDWRVRCLYWQQTATLARPDGVPTGKDMGTDMSDGSSQPVIVHAEHMTRRFGKGIHAVTAVRDIGFDVHRAQIFGIVGESGSGKSTMARCVAGLLGLTDGRITLDGKDISGQIEQRDRGSIKRIQMVFQSPEATLNPRQTVRKILEKTVKALTPRRHAELAARVEELAEMVALSPELLDRYPDSLSGGQRQRVAIARAFAADPDVVLCDEPVSALDVSVQAAILRLLTDLQQTKKVSYVFISHDLAIVRYLADWVGVMYLGSLVESGPVASVLAPPSHPYTELLFAAMPSMHDARALASRQASVAAGPAAQTAPAIGCPFQESCPRLVGPKCRGETPPLHLTDDGHAYRCWIEPDTLRRLQRPERDQTA